MFAYMHICKQRLSNKAKEGSGLRTGMVSTVATFGACHNIWYRYPREGGRESPISGVSATEHTWQNQNFCLGIHFDRFEGAGQEADLKEQENVEKCFSNDSEGGHTAISHEMASTALDLFPGRNYKKGYRLINFNTSENAYN